MHHSEAGDFTDISTRTVTYVTEGTCIVTAGGKRVGVARYTYKRLDDEKMAIVIYRPELYQGRRNVVLYAMLDFKEMTDRAVITAGGAPFAIADGKMREVATPPGGRAAAHLFAGVKAGTDQHLHAPPMIR